MQTKLKIKSNFGLDEVELNASIMALTKQITKLPVEVETISSEAYNISCPCYVVTYDNQTDLKKAITMFNDHRYVPLDGFDSIHPNDFTISLENDIIDQAFEHLTTKNLGYLEEQINMLDYICSDIVSEQEDMKTKIDALYAFFEKSGVLYYKQTIEALLEVLEQNGVLGKNSIRETVFQKLH